MIEKITLMILFCSFTIYGCVDRVKNLRKMRAVRNYRDVLFAWSEHPVSSFKYDTISWVAISIHWGSVVVIGVLEFLLLVNLYLHKVENHLLPFSVFVIISGVVSGVGYLWGSVFIHPIARLLGGDRHNAISAEGVLFSGNLILWNAFSHFSFDDKKNIIRLWSAASRGVVSLIYSPPKEHVVKVVSILQTHLATEHMISPPSFVEQCGFPLVMAVGCISIVVLALIFLQLSAALAIILNGILMYLLMLLGGPVLLKSLFGGKTKPAIVE
jgi:hypothetical protein